METVVKENEKEPKLSQNKNDYTEQYKGLFMLSYGRDLAFELQGCFTKYGWIEYVG